MALLAPQLFSTRVRLARLHSEMTILYAVNSVSAFIEILFVKDEKKSYHFIMSKYLMS